MASLKDYALDWLGAETVKNGKIEWAFCENEVMMAKLSGSCLTLGRKAPDKDHHVSMLITGGELHLTLNGDRLGFFAPAYIDFMPSNQWGNVVAEGNLEGYLLVVERIFFWEVVANLRSKISEKMMTYFKRPFVALNKDEMAGLQKLSAVLFGLMSTCGESGIFRREQVKSLLCACQCELWNIVFRQENPWDMEQVPYHWGEIVSGFLYLAHTYCRERHEVGWYCKQLGVSSNALNASLKRRYEKTARNIIDDLLLAEAQVALRNPEYSVQNVSDLLCFSDQSSFGKFFKRCCGVSPALFRRRLEKEEPEEDL